MSYRFAGKNGGHACRWQASANTEEELIAKVSEHVKKKHNVQMMTSTIANWVRANQSGN